MPLLTKLQTIRVQNICNLQSRWMDRHNHNCSYLITSMQPMLLGWLILSTLCRLDPRFYLRLQTT
jgi:hypothetical protein